MNSETPRNDWRLISPTANITTVAATTTGRVDVSATRAAGPGALANESALFPIEGNNLKLRAYVSTAGYSITSRVFGWTWNEDLSMWLQEILCEATGVSHASAGITILGTTLYPIVNWTIVNGSGNARVVNPTSSQGAASLLLDHQGNQLGEMTFTTAAIKTLNALRKAC